jgi:hypothetical protein
MLHVDESFYPRLHRGRLAAFHQARALFEDHAAINPMARGDGADQRAFEILGGLGYRVPTTRRLAARARRCAS